MTNGSLIMAIGGLHELMCWLGGAGVLAPPGQAPRNFLAEIARDGVVGAVAGDPMRSALFWSTFFGLALLLVGSALRAFEKRVGVLPRSFGYQLGALGLAGGLMIPASGFWLAIPVAIRVLRAKSEDGVK